MLSNYLRAVQLQVPHVKKIKSVITLQNLRDISMLLDRFDHAIQYRAAFLVSFYAFLRISNIVPPTQKSFDITRQLCYEDITFTQHGVTLYLKWAKNLQKTEQSHLVLLPKMCDVYLCPCEAILALVRQQKHSPKDPLVKSAKGVFTESMLRRRWSLILRMLVLPHESLTFHSLRRSAASLAFNNDVSMESIRNHGAWNSDSVYQYLFANSQRVREVPNMFRSLEVKTFKGS